MAARQCQSRTIFIFVALALIPLVTSKLCSVFVVNLDDPESYSKRNVECVHREVKNDICCSGTCCDIDEDQVFRIETVDGNFHVEKSPYNKEDLIEIATRGTTIVFNKVNRLKEVAREKYEFWLTIFIAVPCAGILLIIICIVLCCYCCSCCPWARRRSQRITNQTNQTSQVVQIPMQYIPPPQQQPTYPQASPYPRPEMYPDTLQQAHQPPPLQQPYPPLQQQPYQPQSNQQAHQPPSLPEAYQHQPYQLAPPQHPVYPVPPQVNHPVERARVPSVGFQPVSPKPPAGEPNRDDAPSAPFPT